MHDKQSEMRRNFVAVACGEVAAELMTALCDVGKLGVAVVAEVSEVGCTTLAVVDRIQLGIVAGQRLDLSNRYGTESCISVPIILENGGNPGILCGLDRRPACLSDPRMQLMFQCYARLIAQHVDCRMKRQPRRLGPLDKHIVGNLRGLFVAVLAQTSPEGANPALRRLAARVACQTHDLSTLINDVLDHARGRLTGRQGTIWKVDDLHARLQTVVTDMVAANPDRTIITNIAFDQPVDCDPGLIQQLASNLLQNALMHGAPAGPVSFIASTQDNDLEIAVWNEGNVISKQALRNVFTPALRPGADPPAASLGLHTCAAIVRAHLGTIGVTSSPADGTQFVARIPVARSLRLH